MVGEGKQRRMGEDNTPNIACVYVLFVCACVLCLCMYVFMYSVYNVYVYNIVAVDNERARMCILCVYGSPAEQVEE